MSSRNTAFFRPSAVLGDHACPVECITKLMLFIAIVIIVLYIPLGKFHLKCDPECCNRALPPPPPKEMHSSTMCCLCDVYKRLVQVGQVSMEVVELFLCTSIKVMYEVKLKFYEVLDALDRRDLCRSVCCKIEQAIDPKMPPCAPIPKEKVTCKCDKQDKVKCGCKHEKNKKVVCECGSDDSCPC